MEHKQYTETQRGMRIISWVEKVFPIAATLVILSAITGVLSWPIALGLVFIVGVSLALFVMPMRKKAEAFAADFQEKVVRPALERSGLNHVSYQPKQGLDPALVEGSGFFHGYERYTGTFYFAADCKGCHVQQSDVLLERKSRHPDGDGNLIENWVDVARGCLMVCEFPYQGDKIFLWDRRLKRTGNFSSAIGQTELDRRFVMETTSQAGKIRSEQWVRVALAVRNISEPVAVSFTNEGLFLMLYDHASFRSDDTGRESLEHQKQRIAREVEEVVRRAQNLCKKQER